MEIVMITLLCAFIIVEVLNNKRIWDIQKRLNKQEKIKLTNAQKKKMEAMKASFDNLMGYDEDVAMKRK